MSFPCSSSPDTVANCWLAYMDRLLSCEVSITEKKYLKDKMLSLVDAYNEALDDWKTLNKVISQHLLWSSSFKMLLYVCVCAIAPTHTPVNFMLTFRINYMRTCWLVYCPKFIEASCGPYLCLRVDALGHKVILKFIH